MEDFFNIIILIITGIGFVISAVAKKKNKKTSTNTQIQENLNIMDLFADKTKKQSIRTNNENEQFESAKQKSVKKDSAKPKHENKHASTEQTTEKVYAEEQNEPNKEKVSFNLRQAVIYETIINRKHF